MSATTTLKNATSQVMNKTFQPTRAFFRVSQNISGIQQARAVFQTLGAYGDMVEYKVMRCPETLKYLRYGFVVYKNKEDAQKAIADQFIKVQSEVFDRPVDVKIEKSVASNTYQTNRKNSNNNNSDKYNKRKQQHQQ